MIYKFKDENGTYVTSNELREVRQFIYPLKHCASGHEFLEKEKELHSYNLRKRREQKKFMRHYGIKELPDWYEIIPCLRLDGKLYDSIGDTYPF